jgi:hypothetical protein
MKILEGYQYEHRNPGDESVHVGAENHAEHNRGYYKGYGRIRHFAAAGGWAHTILLA